MLTTYVSTGLSCFFFFLMIRRPPRSTLDRSSAASDVYKRQQLTGAVESNQPVVVSLVLTPRVTGTRLTAELTDSPTLQLAKQTLVFASAKTMAGTELRRSFSITPGSITPGTTPANCLLYTSPSPRDPTRSRMPSYAYNKKQQANNL